MIQCFIALISRPRDDPFTTFKLILKHFDVWDTTRFVDVVPTPSPIVHPVTFNFRAICTPSRRLKSPVLLGSAFPRWHTPSIRIRLLDLFGADQGVFGRLYHCDEAVTEPHAELHGNELHQCALVVLVVHSSN